MAATGDMLKDDKRSLEKKLEKKEEEIGIATSDRDHSKFGSPASHSLHRIEAKT